MPANDANDIVPPHARWLKRVAIFTITLSLLIALPALTVNLGLSAEGDAVDYRVPLLKWMLRHREYPYWSWSVVDDYPMLGELFMLPLFAIKQSLARLIPLFAYAFSAYFIGKIFLEVSEVKSVDRKTAFLVFVSAASD